MLILMHVYLQYIWGMGTPTASQQSIFDSENSHILLVLLAGFEPQAVKSSWVQCSTNWATHHPHVQVTNSLSRRLGRSSSSPVHTSWCPIEWGVWKVWQFYYLLLVVCQAILVHHSDTDRLLMLWNFPVVSQFCPSDSQTEKIRLTEEIRLTQPYSAQAHFTHTLSSGKGNWMRKFRLYHSEGESEQEREREWARERERIREGEMSLLRLTEKERERGSSDTVREKVSKSSKPRLALHLTCHALQRQVVLNNGQHLLTTTSTLLLRIICMRQWFLCRLHIASLLHSRLWYNNQNR